MKFRNREISTLKEELYIKYHTLMATILFAFALIHLLIIKDIIMGYYCLAGMIFVLIMISIFKFPIHLFSLEKLVFSYLITAPIYAFFVTFYFWKVSIVNLCWFVPIPLGAYIFLGKKYGLFFSCYSLSIASVTFLTTHLFTFQFQSNILANESIYRCTDFLVFGCNISIVYLFVHHKDKIRDQELFSTIEKRAKITLPNTLDEEEISYAKLLFIEIENEMINNRHFINPKFSISQLTALMGKKSSQTSKAIRLHGYSNFNAYINSHRINYAKELIEKNNLEKVTLMYIYTESGFANQSTFNKAFKNFTGMTPSEYLLNLNK
ncbi:helix-turn-helix domain-containing protein [Chryseobacterium sp. MYb7]|uniref:helix-turn-helix domain-containing protein n=1 Tax=Chryseobacterium sp. MYb7 TaxID=1827290 RepID=UPI0013FDF012|nr:AraC family transcriptional regulator [Chryseobacterium sp. MYb7]